MKLTAFETEIDPVILERGLDYFKRDKIIDVQKEDDRHYTFTVEGTKPYTVTVTFAEDRNTITHTHCDCPYDKGPFCKHQAATFYHLSVSLGLKGVGVNDTNLRLSLSRLYKNELIELLVEMAVKYPSEQEYLLMKHAKYRLYPDLRYLKMTFVEKIEFYLNGREDLNSYTLMDVTDDLAQVVDIAREIDELVLFFNTQLFFYTEVLMIKEYTQDQFGSIDALLTYILLEMQQRLDQNPFISPVKKANIIITLELTLDHKLYDKYIQKSVQLIAAFKDYLEEELPRRKYIALIKKKMDICKQRGDHVNFNEFEQLKQYVERWYEG
ncbi:SWIM zinc finger [Alkalibacterium subtropicum]|uniref:SWIM zinc finger n=1 Tax=Alkalibacterium subtropicum TaxID=753702 RepID=A0A1I1L106_9LACT|nr:SWIM zinc finger family protein [Alkalibacterium subtropicum]SFC66615.1 SWIM zinc finger [Alkalibacterium subtropicum]